MIVVPQDRVMRSLHSLNSKVSNTEDATSLYSKFSTSYQLDTKLRNQKLERVEKTRKLVHPKQVAPNFSQRSVAAPQKRQQPISLQQVLEKDNINSPTHWSLTLPESNPQSEDTTEIQTDFSESHVRIRYANT